MARKQDLVGRRILPALRFVQCSVRGQALDHDTLLPRLLQAATVQPQNWDSHGGLECFSEKHFGRYVVEFAEQHSIHDADDTTDQMAIAARQTVGKRLRYTDLVS